VHISGTIFRATLSTKYGDLNSIVFDDLCSQLRGAREENSEK
jgi:hypothetical protein